MELQIFENEEFGGIRTITEENGTVLFCGSDVAKALGYSDATNALKQHCKKDGVVFHHLIDSMGRKQRTKFITEGNLYRLILRSKLAAAEKFEQWVVETVLPTIRRHGAYITPEVLEQLSESREATAQLVSTLRKEQEQSRALQAQVTELAPKAYYFDKIVDSDSLLSIRTFAKELNLPEKLFTFLLVEMRFAYRTKKNLLLPTAFMVNNGYAVLKEYIRNNHHDVYMLFTPKGRLYVARRIEKRLAIKNSSGIG